MRPFVWAVDCRLNQEQPEEQSSGGDTADRNQDDGEHDSLPVQEGQPAPEIARLLYSSPNNPFQKDRGSAEDQERSAASDVSEKAGPGVESAGVADAAPVTQPLHLERAVADMSASLGPHNKGQLAAAKLQMPAASAGAGAGAMMALQRPKSAAASAGSFRPQVCMFAKTRTPNKTRAPPCLCGVR